MRKILFVLLLMGGFISCNNFSKDNNTEAIDSAGFLNDNIKKDSSAQRDSLDITSAMFVYRDVKFGMSKSEYKSIIANTFNKVGAYEYAFYPEFNNKNELYLLKISTVNMTANYIDSDLKEYLDNLYKVICNKYGIPDHLMGEIDFFNFKPGFIQWKYGWDIKTKRIRIGMSEQGTGSKYSSVMWIYDQNMMGEIENQSNENTESNIKKDSEKF